MFPSSTSRLGSLLVTRTCWPGLDEICHASIGAPACFPHRSRSPGRARNPSQRLAQSGPLKILRARTLQFSPVPFRTADEVQRLASDGPRAKRRRIIAQDKEPRRILTVYEVRDEYGIPISTQRQWRAEGRFVPFFRAGKSRIAYRRELIDRWVEEQEQKEQAARGGRRG